MLTRNFKCTYCGRERCHEWTEKLNLFVTILSFHNRQFISIFPTECLPSVGLTGHSGEWTPSKWWNCVAELGISEIVLVYGTAQVDCVPQEWYVRVLTPFSSEYDLIWRWRLYRGNQVKTRIFYKVMTGALIKGETGCRDPHRANAPWRWREGSGWSSSSQGLCQWTAEPGGWGWGAGSSPQPTENPPCWHQGLGLAASRLGQYIPVV